MLMITTALSGEATTALGQQIQQVPGTTFVSQATRPEAASQIQQFLNADATNRVLVLVEFAADALANALQQGNEALSQQAQQWQHNTEALLTLHKLDRKRIRLVNLQSAQYDPHALQTDFGVAINLPQANPEHSLNSILASQWLTSQAELSALDQRLRASSKCYNEAALTAHTATTAAEFTVHQRHLLAERDIQLAERQVQLEEKEQQLNALQQQLATAKNELAQSQQANNELREENDLILNQLHQVQEELEQQAASAAERAQQLNSQLVQQAAEAKANSEAQTQQHQTAIAEKEQQLNAVQQQLVAANNELAQSQQAGNELKEENDLLLNQLHQVQEELERKFLENGELKKQQESVNQQLQTAQKQSSELNSQLATAQQQIVKANAELETLKQQLSKAEQAQQNAEQKAKTEREAQKQQHAKELNSLDESLKQEKAKNKDLAEENDLILNQLHLVQEELERYYQELRSTKQLSDSHARKLEQLNENMLLQTRKFNRDKVKLQQVQGAFSWKLTKLFRAATRLYPKVKIAEQVKLLKASDLFDEHWYLQRYPDVAKAGLDAAIHYLRHGAKEGRNPGPNFDTEWYLRQYPDVKQAKMNPLVHYILFGIEENRKVSPRLLTHRA